MLNLYIYKTLDQVGGEKSRNWWQLISIVSFYFISLRLPAFQKCNILNQRKFIFIPEGLELTKTCPLSK